MLLHIFCDIDDSCKSFEKQWTKQLLSDGKVKRVIKGTLSMSEVMTITEAMNKSFWLTSTVSLRVWGKLHRFSNNCGM